MSSTTDRIERKIVLKATRARIWQALTNIEEFNSWFRVRIPGRKFVAGQKFSGQVAYPGYEHVVFEVTIEKSEPEKLLAWRWHPAAIDPKVDYSDEPTTLVEFQLQDAVGGTLLTVVESGIDKIPVARRLEVFRMNSGGWDAQMQNIGKHVATS
jgi:uncharacterized protein YndB with AHSA1/START domain